MQTTSVCPVRQEALSDEESAEAPPAAEEARRFRGSVPTAGRGSGWEPADTTVSAEEHAKKSPPKWVVIYVITHRFCCSHPRISQGRGSVRGKPLRVSPLAFNHPPAGDRFCAAKSPLQKNTTTQRVVVFFWSGRRGSNSLPGIPRMAVAIRRSPASPLDLTRFAQVEATSSSLPATFQKENTILTDGVSFWSGRRGSNSLPRPWQGRALPDELRPQTAPLLRHLGASGRSRTNDTRIFSPLLYQLSYRGIWRPRRGSNPRPPA